MIVLDTNVVSYIFDRDGRARYYMDELRGLSNLELIQDSQTSLP